MNCRSMTRIHTVKRHREGPGAVQYGRSRIDTSTIYYDTTVLFRYYSVTLSMSTFSYMYSIINHTVCTV